ncbi:MAG: hypothetical protein AB7G47_21290 [Mycolicibacterium sp.]|uniref:hypothetical protein n=1 Tax=Mycolicibacterium sp. TaxID=2320850 RepID=UPI003D0B6AAB
MIHDEIPPPVDGMPLDHVPNIPGHEGVCRHVHERYSMGMTPRYVRGEADKGELPYFIVAGKRHFTEADVYRWIMTRPRRYKGCTKFREFDSRTANSV